MAENPGQSLRPSLSATEEHRFPGLDVSRIPAIPDAAVDTFYDLYEAAFASLRARAAARHVLHRDEFAAELADPQIDKYVAWSTTGPRSGQPIGLATITPQLDLLPWISPDFFRARYPEQAAANTIFYLGFVLADPALGLGGGRVFHRLMEVMTAPVAAAGGVAAYDICAQNNQTLRFADRIETTLDRFAAGSFSMLDEQRYYAVSFAEQEPRSGSVGA